MSRWKSCLMSLAIALGLCVFSCGACFIIYAIIPFQPVDIVILGLDSREGEGFTGRTDSILLMGVNTDNLSVGLLSLPRDLFIDVPNYGQQRINTINVLGEQERVDAGVELMISSLNANFDVGVDRYVRMDFNAFVGLIDAVGGVDVYVEKNIIDYEYPTEDYGVETVQFDMGWQHLDGITALKYVRTRHADDDYARAQRQQQVVSALGIKLLNPAYWQPALNVWNEYIDTNVTLVDMLIVAPTILLTRGEFNRLVVNRDYILAGEKGAIPNYEAIAPFIETYFD